LPRDKKGTANFVLANPSTRELYRKIVVEFQLLPENTTRAMEPSGTNFREILPLLVPEYFFDKYNRVTFSDKTEFTSQCKKGIQRKNV